MKSQRIGFKKQAGFTLIELTIVMAILAVLAAIVFPTVTGLTSRSRNTTESQDTITVQDAVTRYQGESSSSAYPTKQSPSPQFTLSAFTTWSTGYLPNGTGPTGSGTLADPYVFSAKDLAAVYFTASTTVSGSTKTFYSDYLKSLPGHSTDTITVAGSGTSSTYKAKRQGSDVWIKISNTATGSIDFAAWNLDPKGSAWVFVDQDSY